MKAVRNYQKELDKIIEQISELPGEGVQDISVPTLFLHSCCAPCSSYVLEYLRTFFRITVFFYNPNITEDTEYRKRMEEQKRLIACYNESLTSQSQEISAQGYPIGIVEGDYDPDCFYRIAKGLEKCPEGGERCFGCYALRLKETVSRAAAGGYDYFTTTLTRSEKRSRRSTALTGCPPILRSGAVISVPLHCQRSMIFTDRIIAAVFIPISSGMECYEK